MSNNITFNLNASEIFNRLDAKDGISDNSIKAKEWNDFATSVAGKSIKYAILKENAIKSINYYLTKISAETKKSVAEYLGAEFNSNNPKATNPAQDLCQKQSQDSPQETSTKIDLANKTSNEIFNELDLMDGKKDNNIIAKYWNSFATQVGGKSINIAIGKERALKSINYYLRRLNKPESSVTNNNTEFVQKRSSETKNNQTKTTNTQQEINNNNAFEKDTLELNRLKYQHDTEFLKVAQDSLGLYEITSAEYEYLKRENPEELKNTQAVIVGDYGMKNSHQWCAYTVGYLAQEAGLDIAKFSAVQAYINEYKEDYNQISRQEMTQGNYNQERLARAEEIRKQLPKMHEGDFIIWKGDYVVPQANGTIQKSKASHIGIIEHVDLEKGVVTVIEGNANVSETNEYQERVPVKTKADCKRGAQTFGEYKEINNRDGLIRKQYTIEELSKHGYTGFIDNQKLMK